jgi:anti-sigma B factor antagonist
MFRYHHLGVREHSGVLVVSFGDQWILDRSTVNTIHDELYSVAKRIDCCHLLLNFAGVTFLPSLMFAKLLTLQGIMAARGGELKLCEVEPAARRVFAETKLNRIIDIQDTEADALQTFGCCVGAN